MAKRDGEVWARFLDLHAAEFRAFAYDVALGGVALDAPDLAEADRLGWKYTTALRVDACGMTDSEIWIIEVKPNATASALGAAVAYPLVAKRERAFDLPLQPAIVCNYCQPDVKWAALQLGIRVVEVPA
jgi:hypothetical protein